MMEVAGEATGEAQCGGAHPQASALTCREAAAFQPRSCQGEGPNGSTARSLPGPPAPRLLTVLRPLVWLSKCRAGVPGSPFIA